MSESSRKALRRILGFAAVVEVTTGLALILDPALVVRLLLGADHASDGVLLGRFLGLAVLALGVACWPGRDRGASLSAAFRAMLTYNALVALYLSCLATIGHTGGPMLWPGVLLHVAVVVSLIWAWRGQRRT